ncbi:MAG: glycosyltransferase [Acidobacteriota bacterium]|nr:glycosyltransferase [Acidobacteriota bacterium]MDH3523246.1 glycosyltransferase [Acidobacteriota bacterium]
MLTSFGGPVLALYYLVLAVLAFYGLHRLVLLAAYYRTRRRGPRRPEDPAEWPLVTVQLPVYNERYVATRLIDAVCRFDYPRDRLEIQVLDDSTDDTRERVAVAVRRYRALGYDVTHLQRAERTGYKAGALAAGCAAARGELVAVFDADFVPPPDFLRRTVPYFEDRALGVVQARWEHVNRDYSLLTRAQAILLDAHFLIEHQARNRSGNFFNFNGTAGLWRRQAILDAGGWEHDTLTEDLDLSYRAQLAGWRFLFVPEVTAPAELPVDVNAFKRQQFRWAKGSIQTARKLLARILRSDLPWTTKLEAFVHLTNNSAYPLMVLLSLLVFPSMLLRRDIEPQTILFVDLPLFFGATIAVLLYYLVSQRAATGGGRGALRYMPAVMGLGIGLAVNNARAAVEGLYQAGGVFERTPKYRIEASGDRWRRKRYRVRPNLAVLVEGLFAAYFTLSIVLAWMLGMWSSLPFLYLFLHGYWYIFLLTLLGGRRAPWRRPARLAAGSATRR